MTNMRKAQSPDDIIDFLREVFPQINDQFVIEDITPQGARVRMPVAERHLRPGNTFSGPSMFGLADVGMYIALLAHVGLEPLMVTTNCSIDFMRRPVGDSDMLCDMTLLKVGRQLAVGQGLLFTDGDDRPVARASLTYAIPSR